MAWWGRRKTDPPTVKPGETTVDPPAPPVFTQGVRADLKLSGGPPSNVMQFPDPKNKRLPRRQPRGRTCAPGSAAGPDRRGRIPRHGHRSGRVTIFYPPYIRMAAVAGRLYGVELRSSMGV